MGSDIKPIVTPNRVLFNNVATLELDFTLAALTAYDVQTLDLSGFDTAGIYAVSFGYLRDDPVSTIRLAIEQNRQLGFVEISGGFFEPVYHRWIFEGSSLKFQVFNPNDAAIVPIAPFNTAIIRYIVLTT